MTRSEHEDTVSVAEAAVIRKVTTRTVMTWIKKGMVVFDQPGGAGGRIFIYREGIFARREKRA